MTAVIDTEELGKQYRGRWALAGCTLSMAQDAPLYAGLPVADHLRQGAHLNPGWDADLAHRRGPLSRGPGYTL